MLKVLDLFSGIGGFSIGLERAGMETVSFCEIEPFCQRVLSANWPEVPIHDDVRTREFTRGEADVVCGGFPCQDISHAGPRTGISGERSGLWREQFRAIRLVRPIFALLENVAALLDRGMGTVLGDLAEEGYDAEWDCIPTCEVGAPHTRERVFAVAYPQGHVVGERLGLHEGIEREIQAINDGSRPRAWVEAERPDGGLADAVPEEIAWLKALGNSVSPVITEMLGRIIVAAWRGR